MSKYLRFGAMVATSAVVMFGLMYLNSYSADHIFFSQTRMYMALIYGVTMAIIMRASMLHMYKSTRANIGIFAASATVFAIAFWLFRSRPRWGCCLYEGDDSAPFDCGLNKFARTHLRSARTPIGGSHHQGSNEGDRRDKTLINDLEAKP